MKIGQFAQIKEDQTRVLITGFYKAVAEPEVTCDIFQEILDEEKAEQIKAGTYKEKVRIAPCNESEAELISYKGTGAKGDRSGHHTIKRNFTLENAFFDSDKTTTYYAERHASFVKGWTEKEMYQFTFTISKVRL